MRLAGISGNKRAVKGRCQLGNIKIDIPCSLVERCPNWFLMSEKGRKRRSRINEESMRLEVRGSGCVVVRNGEFT
jgi:hypothetical protein